MECSPLPGDTTTTAPAVASREIGTKSRTGAYLIDRNKYGLAEWVALPPISRTYPSAGARATYSAAVTPLAPGRFSTTKLLPSFRQPLGKLSRRYVGTAARSCDNNQGDGSRGI